MIGVLNVSIGQISHCKMPQEFSLIDLINIISLCLRCSCYFKQVVFFCKDVSVCVCVIEQVHVVLMQYQLMPQPAHIARLLQLSILKSAAVTAEKCPLVSKSLPSCC